MILQNFVSLVFYIVHQNGASIRRTKLIKESKVIISDRSGMKKVVFGRVRVYPTFEMTGSGMSGIGKLGLGRVRV